MRNMKAPIIKLRLSFPKPQYVRNFIRRLKPKLLLLLASKAWVLFYFKRTLKIMSFNQHISFYQSFIIGHRDHIFRNWQALVVVFSCERFKGYVYELRLTVVANRKQLKLYSPSCSEPPTCMHRWSLRLQKFDFKLEYKPGMNNIVDALSTKPFFDT